MSEHEQPEALRLARWHKAMAGEPKRSESKRIKHKQTEVELQRLHNEVIDLQKALAASQQSVQYHPCTVILIQGLSELKGGSAVLQRWDEARLLADAKLTK